jgi:hypothetical protein
VPGEIAVTNPMPREAGESDQTALMRDIDLATPRRQDQIRPPRGGRSRSDCDETAERNQAPRNRTTRPGRHEAVEPERGRGYQRREAVAGRACYNLSETMKFECKSGRHEAGEPDQAATRRQRGLGAGSGGAPSQGGEQLPIAIGHGAIFVVEILSVHSEISIAT